MVRVPALPIALAGRFSLAPRRPPPDDVRARCQSLFGPAGVVVELGELHAVNVGGSSILKEDVLCVVDGVLHNAQQLRTALELDTEANDAEIVAAAWRRWNTGALGRLRGDYAIVLWHRAQLDGFLAVDHMGTQGLYMTEQRGGLLFASELHLLMALTSRTPDLDAATVADWVAARAPSGGRTLFSGVTRVPGGHWISLRGGQVSAPIRYWLAGDGAPLPVRQTSLQDDCVMSSRRRSTDGWTPPARPASC